MMVKKYIALFALVMMCNAALRASGDGLNGLDNSGYFIDSS